MSKINVRITLKTSDNIYTYEVSAIYKDEEDILIYQEPTEEKTLVKYNYSTQELTRENKELKMIYPFKKMKETNGTITMKELNNKLDLNIKTTEYLRCSNNITVDYTVEKEKYNYKIEVI